MSSTDQRGIPPGNAAIIGAVSAALITACATVLAAWISVASGKVVITVGGTPSQQGISTEALNISSLPQPTYTLLPTYTPYPTLKPNATVVTPKPLIIIATPSPDQQIPAPGSIILASQSYTKNGVAVTLLDPIQILSDQFIYVFRIDNQSGRQLPVLWKNSFVHARDDAGKVFHQFGENDPNWARDKQFAIPSGAKHDILSSNTGTFNQDDAAGVFIATFKSTTKYVIISVDQLVGMTNMNWRYDLQQR